MHHFARRCAGAVDGRIRLLASKALTGLVQPACLPSLATRIFRLVAPTMHALIGRQNVLQVLSHNLMHGLLLQVVVTLYWSSLCRSNVLCIEFNYSRCQFVMCLAFSAPERSARCVFVCELVNISLCKPHSPFHVKEVMVSSCFLGILPNFS